MSAKDFAKRLAETWASLPNEKNESVYKGKAGTKR